MDRYGQFSNFNEQLSDACDRMVTIQLAMIAEKLANKSHKTEYHLEKVRFFSMNNPLCYAVFDANGKHTCDAIACHRVPAGMAVMFEAMIAANL